MTGNQEAAPHSGGRQFVRAARVVSGLTLVSRISGLVRDITFFTFFGATGLASAFTVAFTVPNLFRRLFGEGALSAALIPTLSKRLQDRGMDSGAALTGRVFARLGLTVVGLVLVGELLLLACRPAWGGLKLEMAALLLPYAVPICLVAAVGGVLNVLGRFAVPASAPILLNAVMIAALLGAYAYRPDDAVWRIWVLGGAVLAAGALQLLVQLGALRAAGFRARWRLDGNDPGLREITAAMLPMMIGLAAVQINAVGDVVVALAVVPYEGAPAVLYGAQRLYQFPLGVFSLAFATAVFPVLSAQAAAGDRAALVGALAKSIRVVFYVGVATGLGLMVTARPLVAALFEHGEFTAESTLRVSSTLCAYAVGVWAYGLNHILVRGFYAMGDRKTPMRVALVMVVVNLGLNLSLVWRWEEAGLGAATAISAAMQCVWLGAVMSRRLGQLPWRELAGSGWRSIAGGAVMAAVVLTVDHALGGPNGSVGPLLRLAVLVPAGAVTYLLATFLLRSPEPRELIAR